MKFIGGTTEPSSRSQRARISQPLISPVRLEIGLELAARERTIEIGDGALDPPGPRQEETEQRAERERDRHRRPVGLAVPCRQHGLVDADDGAQRGRKAVPASVESVVRR